MTTAPKRKIVLVLFFARFQTLLWKILDISRWVWYNRYVVNWGVAQLVARVVWEHRRCSHRTKAKTAENPSTVRISGGSENEKKQSKMCLTTYLTTYSTTI